MLVEGLDTLESSENPRLLAMPAGEGRLGGGWARAQGGRMRGWAGEQSRHKSRMHMEAFTLKGLGSI